MKHFFTSRLKSCVAAMALLWPAVASAAPFTPGNIVVARVGDGTATLGSTATAVFLVEYTPAGTVVQTIALPTTATSPQRALTASGTSTSELALTRSADGQYLILTGYDAAVGTTGITGTASTATPRVIGRIAADGTFDTSTAISDAFTATSIRSAASADGTSFYALGGVSGVRYVPFANPAATATVQLNTAPTNTRVAGVFGGNLYITSGSSPYIGVNQIGTGLPTTTGQAATLLPGLPGAGSPYGFYFADLSTSVAGVDVVYVADDGTSTSGIQKYSLVAGSWVSNGTIGSGTALRGLTATTASGTVTLYATVGASTAAGGGSLYTLTDNAGYNAAPSTTTLPTAIATAATNIAFRGVALAPVAATSVQAPTITSFTPTTGAAGTTVTITGTNFTGATAVTLNGASITGFTVVNATTITFTVPATASTGAIGVTTPGGTVASTGTFTFIPAATTPTITSFTPTTGAAGVTVTVTGTNFTGATTLTVGGIAVTGFTVVSATSITFVLPATAVTGPIVVTTPSGTATSSTSFTVTPTVAAPTITSFTPARAIAGVGFTLNVSGTNLVAGTTISFNGVNYTGTIAGTSGSSYNVTIPSAGVPAAGTYNITATNSGGTSAPLSFLVVAPATTVAYEDFEQGSKGAYAVGTVTLRSGDWTFTEALTGNQFNDKANQVQSARVRGGGSIAMNFDKTTGAGVVTVNAALYGSDATASFILEVSTNGGTTYTTVAGAPAALTTTLTPYTFTVNRAGNVRFRISSTNTVAATNPRINIDDINITGYTGTATAAAHALPGLALYPNPATDRITVELPTAGAATVALRDLTGRVVLAPAALAADKQLRLPAALAAGVYLLEVSQNGVVAVRRIEKN
ncbi:IPT/TIG domain-containing protein [Hymenobacter daeguensis]